MITMDNEAARLLMLQSSGNAAQGPACRLHEGLFASAAVKGKGRRKTLRDPSVNLEIIARACGEPGNLAGSPAKVMVILVIRPPSLGPYMPHVQFLGFAARDTLLVIYMSAWPLDLWHGLVAHDGGAGCDLTPAVEFLQGDMTASDVPDGAWAGIAAFYSILHIPPGEMCRAANCEGFCYRAGCCFWRSTSAMESFIWMSGGDRRFALTSSFFVLTRWSPISCAAGSLKLKRLSNGNRILMSSTRADGLISSPDAHSEWIKTSPDLRSDRTNRFT